jgi:hypothetical protein
MLPTSSDNRNTEAEHFSITQVNLQQTARCHVPDDGNLYRNYRAPYVEKTSSIASQG